MSDNSPFLSAGLPGLTFALSLGRGLSIQVDPAGAISAEADELNPPDEKFFINDTTLPSALLVLHFFALHNIVIDNFEFEDAENIILYVTFSIGSTKKASSQQIFQNKAIPIVFNEIKYIPLEVTLVPNEHTNKLVVLVYACAEEDRHAINQSEHKMIGRYEAHLHTLLKYTNGHEKMNVMNKKGVTVGEIEFEFGVTYGSFGYGQSNQLKNDLYTPDNLVRMSMLPRLLSQEDNTANTYRGTAMYPRKLKHPPFIPVIGETVENLEPEMSEPHLTGPPAVECPSFPLLEQNMQRLAGLKNVYAAQPTRSRRICFLRNLLRDGVGKSADEGYIEQDDTSDSSKPAPIPPALAMLMNTSRFIQHAPGIVRRRSKQQRASLPSSRSQMTGEVTNKSKLQQKPRAHSIATTNDFEAMRDMMFSRRRQSLAATKSKLAMHPDDD